METSIQVSEKEIELANKLTLKAIQESYKTALRSNRSGTSCTFCE